ncbi:hypothetical protein TCAL_14340 [Tigriopus californicus]|uniref:Sulfotransferase domain-containing protein n=2 Tax=Tigriopus californicus TaxID=6832 RepID=A0A553NAP5_TIGCA|nr:hypothetical protein TCAL_14340 [Tigriopus californicus]
MYIWVRFCQCIFKYLNAILKVAFGYSLFSGKVEEAKSCREDYAYSVHRCNILTKGKMIETEPASRHHFLLTHDSYDHPNVLKADNVALLSVTETHALFVEGPPGFNFYGSEQSPFTFIVHFKYAQKVLAIRLDHFLKFAQELGPPKDKNIIFICTTGRCGSTLLTQMMDGIPNTLSMSEPDFITLLANGKKPSPKSLVRSRSDSDELLRALIYVQCKDLTKTKVDNYVVKLRPSIVAIAHRIARVCPEIKHIFAYRSPEKTVASFINTVKLFPTWVFRLVFKKYVWKVYESIKPDDPELDKFFVKMIENSMQKYDHVRCWTEIVLTFYLFCKTYQEKKLVDFQPVAYEELLAQPEMEIMKILRHCSIQTTCMNDLLLPLQNDSQKGSPLSRDNVRKVKAPDFTDAQILTIERTLAHFGFPQLTEFRHFFEPV